MQYNKQNKLFLYFSIFISFFILIFFAKDIYATIQENNDALVVKETELSEKRIVLLDLEALDKKIKANKFNEIEEIAKFEHEIKEDEIIEYFYTYVNNNKNGSGYILIESLSMDKGIINEYGFNEGRISLNLSVSDESKMFEFIDFVTSTNSRYKFFIDNFTFPNDKSTGAFNINVPLRVFYK